LSHHLSRVLTYILGFATLWRLIDMVNPSSWENVVADPGRRPVSQVPKHANAISSVPLRRISGWPISNSPDVQEMVGFWVEETYPALSRLHDGPIVILHVCIDTEQGPKFPGQLPFAGKTLINAGWFKVKSLLLSRRNIFPASLSLTSRVLLKGPQLLYPPFGPNLSKVGLQLIHSELWVPI